VSAREAMKGRRLKAAKGLPMMTGATSRPGPSVAGANLVGRRDSGGRASSGLSCERACQPRAAAGSGRRWVVDARGPTPTAAPHSGRGPLGPFVAPLFYYRSC
jgi:hypothetical protein